MPFLHFNTIFALMLNKLFCVFLVVLIISSSFYRLFYFAGYEMNKDYIAKVLCININKPELNCKGKCFLTKKIAEAEKKQQNQERKAQKDISQQVMLLSSFKMSFLKELNAKNIITYKNNYKFKNNTTLFHPPSII